MPARTQRSSKAFRRAEDIGRGGTAIVREGKANRSGPSRKVSAIVLAAGTSIRMGQPKPLLSINDRPLLDPVLDTVRRSRVDEIVVVLGHAADRVRKAVPLHGTVVVENPDYERGMSTSLQAGIRSADSAAEAFLVVLGDQPFVSSETIDALVGSWKRGGARILIPTFLGKRGNPVLVDRSLAGEVDTIRGDTGCRALFHDHPQDIREVPVDDPGILVDIDTPNQLENLTRSLASGRPVRKILEALVSTDPDTPASRKDRPERLRGRSRQNLLVFASELEARGEPFVLATVVRVTRPTSGKVGNRAIIRTGASVTGWVGGSCTESAVLAESTAALRDGKPRLLRLSKEPSLRGHEDGVVEYTMECHSGGAMDIYLEPHVPQAQLLIIGDSPIAEALASFGHLMDYHVTLVAPKAMPEAFPDADEVENDVDRMGVHVKGDTFAVVATMGKYDEAALRALATSRTLYVGLVASRRRAASVRDQLREEGIPEAALARIRNPAGLDLASQTPEEIALSIMAEITKVRRTESAKEISVAESAPRSHSAETVLDVVCGMTVDPETPLKTEHAGQTFYFCSEMCRTQFRKSPGKFLR